jgi:rhamnulokinase
LDKFLYIGIDLGAGSGRVFLAGLAPAELLLEEVRRFHYPASASAGHLRWNLGLIFNEIKLGLGQAARRARQLGRPIRSIGVDSWGVDYGIVDTEGLLIEQPVCYRDQRTEGMMEQVFERIPRAEIFTRTGIQLMAFNTLFQLCAQKQEGIPGRAASLLLIPDLINLFLTGRASTEYTNATTTQMINPETGRWDCELLARLDLPSALLGEIVPAGTELGPLEAGIATELTLENVRVVAPATHDTGSAIAGAPLPDGWAYISSGTWSLVGVEREDVLINAEVARHNFTNEGGAFGTVRLLKNVMGLWILESCRKEWKARGLETDYDVLFSNAAPDDLGRNPSASLIYPDDDRFFNPSSMLAAVATQLAETGQNVPEDPPTLARVILDSLAFRYSSILRTIDQLTGKKITGVQIVGGGSQNDYLNQATATVTGLPLGAGPAEATVIGNVLVQAIAAGRFGSLAEARAHVSANLQLKRFVPRSSVKWEEAAARYAALEARYS